MSAWDKNVDSKISEVKQHEDTMATEQNQNGGGEYQIDEITYSKGGLL